MLSLSRTEDDCQTFCARCSNDTIHMCYDLKEYLGRDSAGYRHIVEPYGMGVVKNIAELVNPRIPHTLLPVERQMLDA